jgi:hypothetical protein
MRVSTLLLALVFAVPAVADSETKSGAIDDSAKIADKLLERISVVDQMDKVLFRDAIRFLQDRTGLTILVDTKAIRDKDAQAVQTLDDAAITLPAMKNVRADTVLRKVLDQVDLDFVITPDHVGITTFEIKDLLTGQARRLPELSPKPDKNEEEPELSARVRTTPYVTASFKSTSATEAFKEIASRAGRNVVVSEAAQEKAKTAITVNLTNVAFETAAASVAEAAGLRAFRNGNVVVIVTNERAKQLDVISALAATGSVGEFDKPFCAGFGESPNLAKLREMQEQIIKAKLAKLTAELESLKQK